MNLTFELLLIVLTKKLMLLHAQVFKDSLPVADWQPSTTYQTEEDLSSASSRLIVRAITSGVLTPKQNSEQLNPEKTGQQNAGDCTTFKKQDLSFHACQLIDKNKNPTNKTLYLVCVTAVDPKDQAESQKKKLSPRTTQPDEEEGDPVEESEEEAKLKFYDFQQALRAEMSKKGALETKSLAAVLTKML